MANVCAVELVLYTDKVECLNDLKEAVDGLSKENNIIYGVRREERAFLDKYFYYRLYGACNWSLDYEALNDYTEKYGVYWASVEDEPGMERFVVNDENDLFFSDTILRVADSMDLVNDYFASVDGIVDYLSDSDFLKEGTKDKVREVITSDLRDKGECWLDLNYFIPEILEEYEINTENIDEHYFRIVEFGYGAAIFWWEREEN